MTNHSSGTTLESNEATATSAPTADTASVTTAVLEAVAERTGDDLTELPPLYDAVDPDALESLFAPTPTGDVRIGRVEFAYHGHVVGLSAGDDGDVSITVEDEAAVQSSRSA